MKTLNPVFIKLPNSKAPNSHRGHVLGLKGAKVTCPLMWAPLPLLSANTFAENAGIPFFDELSCAPDSLTHFPHSFFPLN